MVILFSLFLSVNVSANPIDSGSVVKIIEIIDGDSVKVLKDDGSSAFVRLIGVNSNNNDLAFKFLNNEYLGKSAIIVSDPDIVPYYNRWNYAFVYSNGVCINNLLLEKGYAKPNIAHTKSASYSSMADVSSGAKQASIGVWSENANLNDVYLKDYKININTARKDILMQNLNGINEIIANNIIIYRNIKPFESTEELRKVFGVTEQIYARNRFMLTVETDINKASLIELTSLGHMDAETAQAILEYRYKTLFTDVSQLYTKDFISKSEFNLIVNFITAD